MQKVRKCMLIVSMLLFPVTIYYFSPALIITAGLEGIISGSFIVFGLMLVGSIFFGRLFCAYLCPGGGMQECMFAVNSKNTKTDWKYKIKYVIWGIWVIIVAACYIWGRGVHQINFFYQTQYGVSVTDPGAYIVYYGIVLLIALPALLGGKRAFCHYFCWMAPFMIVGTKIRQVLHLPGVHIAVNNNHCISCKKCNQSCPMSIDVEAEVKQGKISSPECI
ncbi:MAG: 4Fe-4S binding protein [Oscillospiraceae bacterium]